MKIINILKNRQTVSFEFFPPKLREQEDLLFETINKLSIYNPDFVSITYGAGGALADKTLEWSNQLSSDNKFTTMMHIPCIGKDKNMILDICRRLESINISNILALRGDIPKDSSLPMSDFTYASDLVRFIKSINSDFCVGVAGYPEKHGESKDIDSDIDNLKKKLDMGADFIVTQLFFDNEYFYNYINLLQKKGITAPVIAGVMPISNRSQLDRFKEMCKIDIPQRIYSETQDLSKEDVLKFGIDYAYSQCEDLIKNNVAGIHFYTLNKYQLTDKIITRLRKSNIV